MCHKIKELRREIEIIDASIVQLLCHRLEIVIQIGQLKNQYSVPILDEEREQNIVSNILSIPHHPLESKDLKKIFKYILFISRNTQLKNKNVTGRQP
jgi:chorismate mutase/prephenate dehydratase